MKQQNYSIEFEKLPLDAGQSLSGAIFFQINQDYNDAEINIRFVGKEYSKILELFYISQDKKNPNKIPQQVKAKSNNIDISMDENSHIDVQDKNIRKQIQYLENDKGSLMRVVRNYGGRVITDQQIKINRGKLCAGVYKVKFQFATSDGWPSSHQWQQHTDNSKQKAQVRYYIQFLCLDTYNTGIKVYGTRDTIINAFIIPQVIERQVSGDIVGWFCCLRGTVQMRCYIQKNVFIQGEECVIKCEIDNTRCQSPIGPLRLEIINSLILIDESGYEKITTQKILEQEFVGVAAGKSKIDDQAIIIKFRIPTIDLVLSTLGHYVQSKNYLRIEAFTGHSNTQIKSKPIIQIPFTVHNSIKTAMTPPINWPQAQEISIDNQIVYQNLIYPNLMSSNTVVNDKPQQNIKIESMELKMKMTDSL